MRQILMTFLAVGAAGIFLTTECQAARDQLVGANPCTWGPAHWCQNLTTSSKCETTGWCVNKTWKDMQVEIDNDLVCEICKTAMTQAREKLGNNEPQESIEALLSESCSSINIEPITNECNTLVPRNYSNFAEILASNIDSPVVCSIVGLCNSARMDYLIQQHSTTSRKKRSTENLSLNDDELKPDECSKCYAIVNYMENGLNTASRDEVLERMINMCQRLSSFSDACGSIVIEYFSTIYSHLRDNFKSKNVCHLSGQCSAKFHKHEESGEDLQVEIRPLSSVGMVGVGDDLPCKLCEQLVGHLRDLLVANTTENEFQEVLEGLCKRTKSFAAECKSIVDEYYREIYNYLVHGLNKNGICEMAGICPLPGKDVSNQPITLFLPTKTLQMGAEMMNRRKNLGENGAGIRLNSKKADKDDTQLLIVRMRGSSVISGASQNDREGMANCAMCELQIHHLRSIESPSVKYKAKLMMGKICTLLPTNVRSQCYDFSNKYGYALERLIAQKVDPSVVCPKINVCPSEEFLKAWNQIPKDLMLKNDVEEKPNCPLCLLAVGQLYNVIKKNKTEANIEAALHKLCDHLPKDLDNQCQTLVQDYSKAIVETLMADLSPQEICVYLKLCSSDTDSRPKNLLPVDESGEILTNDILQNYPIIVQDPKKKSVRDGGECVICEFIMQHLDEAMSKDSNRDQIKKAVHSVCKHLPKTIAHNCNDFVDQYADVVIQLLSEEISPSEVCTFIKVCQENTQRFYDSIEECDTCRKIVTTIDKRLVGTKGEDEIKRVVSKVCRYMQGAKQNKCTKMMKTYEKSIMNIINNRTITYIARTEICSTLALCNAGDIYEIEADKRQLVIVQ